MMQTGVRQNMLTDRLASAFEALPRMLSIVAEDSSASWQWRVAWPSKALSDHGFIADWTLAHMAGGIVPLLDAGRYNLVVMSRLHWGQAEKADAWRTLLHDHGLLWVYGADDNVWVDDIEWVEGLSEAQRERGAEQLAQDRTDRVAEINRADAVVVSTDYLAGVARRLTDKPVIVVPNLIDAEWFDSRLADAKRTIPPLTIGWSGTFRPDSDLSNVAKAWTRIAARYSQVTFVMHGTRIPVLMDAVPSDRLRILPWSSLADYPRALLNIDIACCSVTDDNEFAESKSPIKWMEASLAGSACVVSRALYGRTLLHNQDGLIADSVDEWEGDLSLLIENQSMRQQLQQCAERRVRSEHSTKIQWPLWINALATLL